MTTNEEFYATLMADGMAWSAPEYLDTITSEEYEEARYIEKHDGLDYALDYLADCVRGEIKLQEV